MSVTYDVIVYSVTMQTVTFHDVDKRMALDMAKNAAAGVVRVDQDGVIMAIPGHAVAFLSAVPVGPLDAGDSQCSTVLVREVEEVERG